MYSQICPRGLVGRRWQRLAMLATVLLMVPAGVHASVYALTSPADVPDANPGNNICETAAGNGVCTLRAAVQESNAHAGPDSIALQPNTTYLLTLAGEDDNALSGDLDITDSVTIAAAGPGAIVDANGNVTLDRAFHVSRCIGNAQAMDGSCTNGNLIATLTGITIQNGRPSSYGGGILNLGMLTLSRSTLANNQSSGSVGGGVLSVGSLTISESTIRGNSTAAEANGFGGGIVVSSGTAYVVASTISGNSSGIGGGIFVSNGAQLNVVNSTISGNFSSGDGGGIANFSITNLYNSTVTLNFANTDGVGVGQGGGVANSSGDTLGLSNSIVSLNYLIVPMFVVPIEDDCQGAISSLGNNMVGTVLSHCTVNGSYMQGSANLGPLKDNGGPTLTHGLIRPSPAIDGGNASGCTDNLGAILISDQRGFPRPEGGRCDIGAFEASDRLFGDGFET